MTSLAPQLRGQIGPRTRAVTLFLHGGTDGARVQNSWLRPAVMRMVPFARAVRRTSDNAIATLRLRNRYYGWSDDFSEPIDDAMWALDRIREQAPGMPIAIVGHSGGGRVALRLADQPGVTAIVGLAPWVVDDDPQVAVSTRVLLAHGQQDVLTKPERTQQLAEELQERGVDVHLDLKPDTHSLLRRAPHWHWTCAGFVTESLVSAEG